jgi:hypothetical protein
VVVKVWAIELPELFEAPVTPVWATVHVYVVPTTELLKVSAVGWLEQVVVDPEELAMGRAKTTTVSLN